MNSLLLSVTVCFFLTVLVLSSATDLVVPYLELNGISFNTSTRQSASICKPVARCLKRLDKGKECALLPVPKRSVLPAVPTGTYLLTSLRKGVWVYNDGAYLTLILRKGKHLAMVDFPDSGGSNKPDGSMTRLTDAADDILNGTVPTRIDMVYSHGHYDHIGGATRFFNYVSDKYSSADILIWGTTETRKVINLSTSKRAIIPTEIVRREGATIELGKGLKIRLQIFGGHMAKDLLVEIPRNKKEGGVVMFVDVVFPRWAPFFNLAITEDLTRYVSAQEDILKMEFKHFIAGHLLIATKDEVAESLKYTQDLLKAGADGVASVTNEDIGAGGIGAVSDPNNVAFGNVWFAFIGVVRKLQIDRCYRTVLEKWGCRIGGLDLVLRSHCFLAVTFSIVEA